MIHLILHITHGIVLILQPTYLAYLQPFSFFIILSFAINEIHILNLSMFNSRMSIIFMNKWIDLD